MFTTIQDLGRNGYRAVGIGPGGAMDFFAASTANYLVSNDATAAVIEMHFPAAEILFQSDTIIAVTGGDFSACIDNVPIELWQPIVIKNGSILSFKKYINGARTYLSANGGFEADQWLSSYSTHLKLKAGGFKGDVLLKEDIIPFSSAAVIKSHGNLVNFKKIVEPFYKPSNIIRCIAAPEFEQLHEASQTCLVNLPFVLTAQSDRMGFRLKGMDLRMENPAELISSPVDAGTVQLLPNGQLIVLMADHQTTGGYPRIAQVIRADIPRLAQIPIHAELNFKLVSIETAEEALLSLSQTLVSIKKTCDYLYATDRHQL